MSIPRLAIAILAAVLASTGLTSLGAAGAAAPSPVLRAAPTPGIATGGSSQIGSDTDCTAANVPDILVAVPSNNKVVRTSLNKTRSVAATSDPSDTVSGTVKYSTRAQLLAPKGSFSSLRLQASATSSYVSTKGAATLCEDTRGSTMAGLEGVIRLKRPGKITAKLDGTAQRSAGCSAYISGPASWAGSFGMAMIMMRSTGATASIKAPAGTYEVSAICSALSGPGTARTSTSKATLTVKYSKH